MTMTGGFSSPRYQHVKHCSTHPKFLHSNSTSHRWAFGAIAELIDNAIDPDVNASQFCIDLKEFDNEPCLVLMDNGCGLDPERLHKMLSFGHSKKQMTPADRSIGKHGNGFKSGTMRLGKDVLVLTKCAVSMTAGFLSQTFLASVAAEDILIPLVTWDLRRKRMSPRHADIEESLQAICRYSIFPDEESILAQLDAIPGTGTILIISNLRRHEGVLEMDYKSDPHDIRITSEIASAHYQQLRPNQPNSTDVPSDYSLRAYVSILYKVPRMQIFIRDKKVKTKRVSGLLSQKIMETYKPMGVTEPVKIEMGFNTENRNLYGMMLYHRNRLIKPYMRVGMQLEENERGMGVLGIVEADFLHPTHNKQDFDDTTAYRRLLKKLSDVLGEYWWEKKERGPLKLPQPEAPLPRPPEVEGKDEDIPDVVWVQCDNPSCLKWRVLPEGTDAATLPDSWFCGYHPNAKYRRHEEPEEEWDASVQHEIIERRKERKREYDRERKEKEAHKRRQRLEVIITKEEQLAMDRQREALRKEMEDKTAKDFEAIAQERQAKVDEVLKLQKELNEMQARRDEIEKQHIELLGRLEADKARKTSAAGQKQTEDNHVQFSEHEISQAGVSGPEELSEERPVDSEKNDEACSTQQNERRAAQGQLGEPEKSGLQSNQQYEMNNGEAPQRVQGQEKLLEHRDYEQASLFPVHKQFVLQDAARRGFQQQEEIQFSGGRGGEEAGQQQAYRQYDGAQRMYQPQHPQQQQQYGGERDKGDESFEHHQLDARFPNKRNKVIEQELGLLSYHQWRQEPQLSEQQLIVSDPSPRHFEGLRSASNNIAADRLQVSEASLEHSTRFHGQQSKGNELQYGGVSGISLPGSELLPGFSGQFPGHNQQQEKQVQSSQEQQQQQLANGNTLGPLSSFQHVNIPSDGSRALFEDGSRSFLPAAGNQQQQQARYHQAFQSVTNTERLPDCNPSSLSLCSDSMVVTRAEPSIPAAAALQRREADSALILSLQGRLRTALKTLLKICGPLESQVDADAMLLSDLEVVTICEKATNYVGMRWQAYEQEIAKLKAELAYTMQGFRIRGDWDTGNPAMLK